MRPDLRHLLGQPFGHAVEAPAESRQFVVAGDGDAAVELAFLERLARFRQVRDGIEDAATDLVPEQAEDQRQHGQPGSGKGAGAEPGLVANAGGIVVDDEDAIDGMGGDRPVTGDACRLVADGLIERSTSMPGLLAEMPRWGPRPDRQAPARRPAASNLAADENRTSPAGLRIITPRMPGCSPRRATMSARPGTSRLNMAFSRAACSRRLKPSEAWLRSSRNWVR